MWWRLHCSWTKSSETLQIFPCTVTAANNTRRVWTHTSPANSSGNRWRVETNLLLEVNFLLLHQLTHPLRLYGLFEQLGQKTNNNNNLCLNTVGFVCWVFHVSFTSSRTKSFSLSWRSSDSFSSSWAWCSLASTSCCCKSLCFTTLSMCWWSCMRSNQIITAGKKAFLSIMKTVHTPLLVVCIVHTVSSISQQALRSLVWGWHFSHCAAPSESGCHSVLPGNEKSPPSFSPPPAGSFAPLHPTVREWQYSQKTWISTGLPCHVYTYVWCTFSVRLCLCSSRHRLSSLLRARMALLCSFLRLSFSWRSWFCFFCSTFICFCVLRCSSNCYTHRQTILIFYQQLILESLENSRKLQCYLSVPMTLYL